MEKYKSAALEGGFKLYWGDDASMQSPDMGDVLLHEAAVAWFRKLMQKQLPECAPWEETPLAWAKRARRAVLHINENFDVPALCREFPTRLHALASGSGERLRKWLASSTTDECGKTPPRLGVRNNSGGPLGLAQTGLCCSVHCQAS